MRMLAGSRGKGLTAVRAGNRISSHTIGIAAERETLEGGGLTSKEAQPDLARALHDHEQQLEAATDRIARLILECRGAATDAHADLARVLGEREQQLRDAATRIEQLRAELARIRGSRLWRVGSVFWALKRWIGRTLRP